jgi:hypothetical protein
MKGVTSMRRILVLLAAMVVTLAVVVEPTAPISDRDGNPGIQAMSAEGTAGERQPW